LAERDRGLGGEGLHDPPVGGGQPTAAQHGGEIAVDGTSTSPSPGVTK